jgi:rhodanese-related sulfurtransferase
MNITPTELKGRLDRGEKFRLIDVREADEWALARLPRAELIPLTQFQERAPRELEPEDEIILYCHHGYENVLNLTGGIDAWSTQVDPSVPRY